MLKDKFVAAQAKVSPHASSSSPALLHPSSDLSVGMLSTDRTVYSRSSCMSTTQCLCAGCQALLYKQPAADRRHKGDFAGVVLRMMNSALHMRSFASDL